MIEKFTREESDQFTFYRIPKELITNPNYKGISTDAKLLYGLLLDRNSLSRENGWFDESGHVYIYYSREEVMELLSVAKEKVTKLFTELKTVELIEEVRQGLGKPNIIYVGKFIPSNPKNPPKTRINPKRFEIRTSESSNFELQRVRKTDFRKTPSNAQLEPVLGEKIEGNKTEINYTEEIRTTHTQAHPETAENHNENHCVCVNTPQKEEIYKESTSEKAKGEEKKSNPIKGLKEEIRKVTSYQVPERKIKELLTASSLERIQFHLENWDIHKQHQRTEGAGWFFTVVENDIPPEKKKTSGTGEKREEKIPQRDNFQQREYTREELEKYYFDLTKEVDWETEAEKKARLEAETKAQEKVKPPYAEVKGHIENLRSAVSGAGS